MKEEVKEVVKAVAKTATAKAKETAEAAKKTAEKTAEAAKKTAEKTAETTRETAEAAKKNAEKTAEAAKKTAEKTAEAAKKTAEKTAEAAKKTAKKTVAKVAAKTAVVKAATIVQYQNNEVDTTKVEEKVKAQFVSEGHKAASIKKLNIYIKPEEYSAYYVINDKFSGRVDLF